MVRRLAADYWSFPDGSVGRERYFYQLSVAGSTSNAWNHTVSGGELDQGMVFAYHWSTSDDARQVLGQMGDYLHLLS